MGDIRPIRQNFIDERSHGSADGGLAIYPRTTRGRRSSPGQRGTQTRCRVIRAAERPPRKPISEDASLVNLRDRQSGTLVRRDGISLRDVSLSFFLWLVPLPIASPRRGL